MRALAVVNLLLAVSLLLTMEPVQEGVEVLNSGGVAALESVEQNHSQLRQYLRRLFSELQDETTRASYMSRIGAAFLAINSCALWLCSSHHPKSKE